MARAFRLVGILVLLVALYFAIPVRAEITTGAVARVALGVALLVLLGAAVAAQVRLSVDAADTRIDGLVVAIALVWVCFAFAFYALAIHEPDQVGGLETRIDALYFVGSTILTIGYGDVHATGQVARTVVLVQMVFDVVFVATAATLLGDHMRRRAADRAAERRRDR